MIEIARELTISGGKSPYSYQWVTDDSCVSFNVASGTTTGKVDVVATFLDSACIAGAAITLVVTDADGCSPTPFSVSFTDPCSTFTLNPITYSPNFTYTVTATKPGSGSVSFNWQYDTVLFEKVGQTNSPFTSTISFKLKNGASIPSTTQIKAIAQADGCEKTAVYTHAFCIPQAQNIVVDMYYLEGLVPGYVSSTITIPDPTGCTGTIDWTTVSYNLPSSINVLPSGSKIVSFSSGNITPATYSGSYTVKNAQGISSNTGNITFVYHAPKTTTISAPNKTFYLDCSVISGETVDFGPLEDNIVVATGATVDWSTWQLVTPPTPKSTSITLVTGSGGKHYIRYTAPTPIAGDFFSWTIADTNGVYAESSIYTVSDCVQAPTAVDDTATVVCGGSVAISPLLNDLANGSVIDTTSVTITEAPAGGTTSISNQGVITYFAPSAYSGTVTIKYKFKNSSGAWSNVATITVTVVCAGTDANVILCN